MAPIHGIDFEIFGLLLRSSFFPTAELALFHSAVIFSLYLLSVVFSILPPNFVG